MAVIAIIRNRHFLYPKPYRLFYFLLYVISMIFRLSARTDSQQNMPIIARTRLSGKALKIKCMHKANILIFLLSFK
jgi:hypothetical protein